MDRSWSHVHEHGCAIVESNHRQMGGAGGEGFVETFCRAHADDSMKDMRIGNNDHGDW